MKKLILPIITLILIIFFISIFLFISPQKITSNSEIEVIKQDSNLDILVNLGEFSKENYSESNLLDVSMQYAMKLNLMNDTTTDGRYIQYVSKEDLHSIIFELTGITVEAPITIEDFYYLYDSENEYYYYIGSSPSYFFVSNINSVKKLHDKYFIECEVQKNEDGEIVETKKLNIILIHNKDASLINYQIEKIS